MIDEFEIVQLCLKLGGTADDDDRSIEDREIDARICRLARQNLMMRQILREQMKALVASRRARFEKECGMGGRTRRGKCGFRR